MIHRLRSPLALAALLLLAGCGTTAQAAAPTPAACRPPGKAVLPHTNGTLTQTDNGASICLTPGQQIAIFLSSPSDDPAGRWQPITAQPAASVKRGNSGVMTLPVGTTGGLFTPTATGRIVLNSGRGSGSTWQVALIVESHP